MTDAVQRNSLLRAKPTGALFTRHEEPHIALQRRRLAHPLCRREVPGKDQESNWLPAPEGTFSLYIRAYWAEQAILDGTWIPPQVRKIN